jgi:hypothetical protein
LARTIKEDGWGMRLILVGLPGVRPACVAEMGRGAQRGDHTRGGG